MVAKISPTSPRGIMPRPMRQLVPGRRRAHRPKPRSLPSTATTSSPPAMPSTSGLTKVSTSALDADLEEEDRDEQVADRRELALDAFRGRAARQREAGDERADDRRELRRVGELGEPERERERRSRPACRPTSRGGRGTGTTPARAASPTTVATTRKPIATSRISATSTIDTEPSETSRTTTVRITRPRTSSATAAPSTVRASTVARARRSLNTRAVIPTLVAASAAPMNSDWLLL